jgi:Uma2 family endonuclease
MYDLPSEDPEEPGLPDVFHDLQPQLLSATLRLRTYPADQVFTGTDLNLYYDVRHSLWHKRPDWFLVLGVPRLYDEVDLRASYVVWQEGVNPFVVVELLSPGTENEDLGRYAELSVASDTKLEPESDTEVEAELPQIANGRSAKEKPPSKWQVYEQILRVPYYIVFSRYTNQLRFFKLIGGHYQEQSLDPANPRLWIPELELGLGLWHGDYEGITRPWLRWYDKQGTWIPTDAERNKALTQQAEQERQRAEQLAQQAEQERQRAEQAEHQLRQIVLNLVRQGMSTAQIAQLTGLSAAEVENLAM